MGTWFLFFQLKVCLTRKYTFKFAKFVLRCPRPRPRGFSSPRSIRPRSRSASLGGKTLLRAAQQIIIVLLFPKRLPRNNPRHHDKRNDIWDCDGQVQEVGHVKDGAEIFNHSASKIGHKQACVVEFYSCLAEQV